MNRVHTLSVVALLLGGVLGGVADAQAQGVQRIVGPDGRVTYTDRAPMGPAPAAGSPSSASAAPQAATSGNTAAPAPDAGALPFALRQAATRYPVTLYTGDKCTPCVSARELLRKRGVPFVEKTVTTPEDGQAFAALGVDNALPLITVGPQRITGFVATDLNRYLDAAGYPAESQLPRTYRQPAPQALAPVAPAAPASSPPAPQAERAATPPAPSVVAPPASNPAGIRF